MIRYLYTILLLSLVCSCANAQEQKPALRQADECFLLKQYAAAAVLYQDVAKKNHSVAVLRKLSYCYLSINQYSRAARTAEKIIQGPEAMPQDYLIYADALKCLALYDEAKQAYTRAAVDTSLNVQERIAGCDSALRWMQQAPAYELENLEAVNTGLSDWGAGYYTGNDITLSSTFNRYEVLDVKAKTVAYKDKRTLEPFLKTYRMDASRYDFVGNLDPVFNQYRYHTGPIVFSPGYTTACFTVTNTERISYIKTGDKRLPKMGERRLQLFISHKVNKKWQQPVPFAYNKPDVYSIGHPAISRDGRVLYFTSDMPGGYGKTDIWYCELQADSTWGIPHNCGPMINTPEQDDFPTINDSAGLYFSSKGHIGMGGLDIFYAKGSGDNWNTPRNLRYPVNSEADDFYLVSNEAGEGMLSSNRSGGKGSDDIYRFRPLQPVIPPVIPRRKILVLQTTVVNMQRQPISDATVWLDDELSGLTWLQYTNQQGNTYQNIAENKTYKATAGATGYTTSSAYVVIDADDTVRVTLMLDRKTPAYRETYPKGSLFVLKDIYYDFDKWDIRKDAQPDLDKLVAIMKQYPGMKVELSSHTDCRGTAGYNMRLSQRRAESAVSYIINKGISAGRITAQGYGKTMLTNNCDCTTGHECNVAQHQANRRTEVKVLE